MLKRNPVLPWITNNDSSQLPKDIPILVVIKDKEIPVVITLSQDDLDLGEFYVPILNSLYSDGDWYTLKDILEYLPVMADESVVQSSAYKE